MDIPEEAKSSVEDDLDLDEVGTKEFLPEEHTERILDLFRETDTVGNGDRIPDFQEFRADSEQEIPALYVAYRPRLFRYVRRLGLHRDDAEEVIQEAFIRLTICIREKNKIERVQGWIVRVVHNFAINKLLKNERDGARIRETTGFEWASFIDPTLTPEEALLRQEQRKELETALSQFSPIKRQCYLMRVQGFHYKDIGMALGISGQRAALVVKQVTAKLVVICE